MSVAQLPRISHLIAAQAASHRRALLAATIGVAGAALGIGFSIAALTGLAVVVALLASLAMAALWLRLRAVERSHTAVLVALAQLTGRLAQIESAAAAAGTGSDVVTGDLIEAVSVAPLRSITPVAAEAITDPSIPSTMTEDARPTDAAPGDKPVDHAVTVVPVAPPLPLAMITAQEEGGPGATTDDASAVGDVALPAPAEPVTGPRLMEEPIPVMATAVGEESSDTGTGGASDTAPAVPPRMPGFALTSLRGDTVTDADLAGRPAVVVLWRPGCDHSHRLTPELVAWESLQGPRLVVMAACDGPTAFRAGLPGLVVLDPAFTVGQALGALGTPAALPLDAAGQPSGPVVTGSSAVTTLLLDAMRDWASAEPEAEPEPAIEEGMPAAGPDAGPGVDPAPGEPAAQEQPRPTVLRRRVEESISPKVDADADAVPDWDTDPATRRVG